MLHFHIITLFPESIEPYLKSSILGKAIEKKKIKVSFYDPKDFTRDKYGRVDRRPYGGGPGMVLEPDAMLRAIDKATKGKKRVKKIFFATDGAPFDESMAISLSCASQTCTRKKQRGEKSHHRCSGDVVLICGRYEGVDARVQKITKAKKVSVGPYVLTGGELPAATMIDAIARFVPGVLGKAESLEVSRIASPEVYTRPEVLEWKKKKYRVPKVLLSGNHAEMDAWKSKKRERT